MSKKIPLILQVFSILSLLFALALFSLSMPAIKTVATENFDLSRWLDADIFVLTWSFYGVIVALILNILSLILKFVKKS
ncbi:hypothetical protein [Enterococcus olivae]